MMRKKLSSLQRRRLDKIIQAGFSHAATTLEKMIGGELRIQVADEVFCASAITVRLGLRGALPGEFILSLPEDLAQALILRLTSDSELSLRDEQARSALMEFGNILASDFVGYYDRNLGLRTLPTPPALSLETLASPPLEGSCCAGFSWGQEQRRGQLLVGFEQSALDILLVG